jgi:hypothetical protein
MNFLNLGDSHPEQCVAEWKKKLIKFAKKHALKPTIEV